MKKFVLHSFSILSLFLFISCNGDKGSLSSVTPSGGQTGSTGRGTPNIISANIQKLSGDLTRYTWSTMLAGSSYAPTRREEYCSRYHLCTQQGGIFPFIVEHFSFQNGISGTLVDGTGSLKIFALLQPVGSNLLGGSIYEIPFKVSSLTEDIQGATFDMNLEVDTSSSAWSRLSPQLRTAFQSWSDIFTGIASLPYSTQPFIFDMKDRFSYVLVFIAEDLHNSMQDLLLYPNWETLLGQQERHDMCQKDSTFCVAGGPYDILVEHVGFGEDPYLPGVIKSGTIAYYGLMGSYTPGQLPAPLFQADFTIENSVYYQSGATPLFDLEWRYDQLSYWPGVVAKLQQIKWVSTSTEDKFEALSSVIPFLTPVKRTYKGM